jgi:hypothetical protein
MNYYHIIMDDMIGMWWTIYHHFQDAEELPVKWNCVFFDYNLFVMFERILQRDVNLIILDDQGDMKMDGDSMLRYVSLIVGSITNDIFVVVSSLTTEPIIKRSDLHKSGKLVCLRRVLVGQAGKYLLDCTHTFCCWRM